MAASRAKNPLNPSIRLSPVHSRTNSRSTSPERNPGSLYQKIDPLLSNLSPESTLHALTSTDAVPTNEKHVHDILSQSISQVSPDERALGIRAALAAQNLELWYKEVQVWTWPNQKDAKVGKGFRPPSESRCGVDDPSLGSLLPSDAGPEYYGSLPASVVEHHEKRIEEIRDGMDDLNVEELKEHVLNAHIPSRSRPSSSTSSVSVPPPLSYVQLSDFTAVVTATILRALPFLSRLNSLLSTWDVRLLVLRQIPGLLRELMLTRSSLDSSLHKLRSPNQAPFSSSSLRAEHVKLESAVVGVGRRMDRILDALEGRQDSLPEEWIDELESIESDFAAWVVESERYTVQNEWMHPTNAESTPAAEPAATDELKQDDIAAKYSAEEKHNECPPQMETIEEQPECDSATLSEVKVPETIEPTVHNDNTPSHEQSTSPVLESHPDPQTTHQQPTLGTDEEDTLENHEPVVLAEDMETPTQLKFLPQPVSEAQQQSSASPERHLAPRDLSYKEKFPPPDFKQEERAPPSPHPSQPAVLSEHKDLVEDPSMQTPTAANEYEANKMRNVDVPVGTVSEQGVDLSSEGNLQSETVLSTEQEADYEAKLPTTPPPAERPRSVDGSVIVEPPPYPSAIPVPTLDTIDVSNEILDARGPDFDSPVGSVSQLAAPENPASSESKLEASKEKLVHEPGPSRKPLQSPIKLSKTRHRKPSLDKDPKKSHRRRDSTGSVASLLSDTSSLISSPGARTGSSNETPHLQPSPHPEYTHSRVGASSGDHTLREDRLLRLQDQKNSLRSTFHQNRAVSLPLERFIKERLNLSLDTESAPDAADAESSMPISTAAVNMSTSAENQMPIHDTPSTPTLVPRAPGRRPTAPRGKPVIETGPKNLSSRLSEHNRNAFAKNSIHQTTEYQRHPKPLRSRPRLTAHPSLESLGVKRQELSYVEEDEAEFADVGSRASTPPWQSRKPRDRLDEKINSILNTLPGRIHLVDSNHDTETSSSSSSLDRRKRSRRRSESLQGAPSRSMTPAPSLTLMPAARKRLSHAHKLEDSCVKLYHLHHGGQTAPTKLFVRTVGEDGQRVMVRVGGGWADLGEYLREYVMHHGRRKVSETPRVEVQGLASHASPAYSSPGSMLTPAAPSSYITSGRATPSRPASVLSVRPPSSLTVRKTRRGSNASDAVAPRAVTTGTLNSFTSPQAAGPSGRQRRLSVSSSYSMSEGHSPAYTIAVSTPHESHSTPLGLAGPKPRSRQISMSPEGEAWVEDVLQQTRRSSSLNPPPFSLGTAPSGVAAATPAVYQDRDTVAADRPDIIDGSVKLHSIPKVRHSLPKVRSIGDIGTAGRSRRVTLRGLGSRKS